MNQFVGRRDLDIILWLLLSLLLLKFLGTTKILVGIGTFVCVTFVLSSCQRRTMCYWLCYDTAWYRAPSQDRSFSLKFLLSTIEFLAEFCLLIFMIQFCFLYDSVYSNKKEYQWYHDHLYDHTDTKGPHTKVWGSYYYHSKTNFF